MNPASIVFTDVHAKYYAHALTRKSAADDPDKLSASLVNATVDLNPHQIDAAIFAFRSPLSRGAILADEVGLGKTIEAGLIISQLWAERKRRILVIVPTTLRKQWAQELVEKFFLESEIFDLRRYNELIESGAVNPFLDPGKIVICSYNFARTAQAMIAATSWDLVVIDEAHRLRNVLKSGNKIARAIKDGIQNARGKVLLTATPLQNTLLELYALTGFLDEHLFGDLQSFKAQYLRGALGQREYRELRNRLRPVCQRTLRRQVAEYVRYTNRISITADFTPSADEQKLYEHVSDYLRRDEIHALPRSQRKLMILILRKLLASSTFAIAGTLASLGFRLQTIRAGLRANQPEIENDFETFSELADEWMAESEPKNDEESSQADIAGVEAEIADLMQFHNLASSITRNAKGEKLLQALREGFAKLAELGAMPKAVIFTESRRTQQYLWDLLTANGYDGRVMTFNGTNTDPHSASIYKRWKERHEGEPLVSGRKDVDMRAALIEHFRETASIMIATEAAAEGVNLQFCSLVVNYDLPWNPQRVEQRIGRCHRYGQKHDVVVINFLNRENEADRRVFEILSEKFRLFSGVFGASDEVLGALESGVDFERRIAEIYQSCRTPEEIDGAFNRLQADLSDEIAARMSTTRATLLEHFDEDVHTRLSLHQKEAEERVGRFERWLWQLTMHELRDAARFEQGRHRFVLTDRGDGVPEAPAGTYRLVTREEDEDGFHPYRLGHPLAQELVRRARARHVESSSVVFDYGGHPTRITPIADLKGRSGWLSLTLVHIEAFEEEDHLLFIAITDDGQVIDQDICEKLFDVAASDVTLLSNEVVPESVETEYAGRKQQLLSRLAERNAAFFEEEIEKLERWAEDLKRSLEQKVKDLDAEIRTVKKEARGAISLEAKLELHRRAKDIETERGRRRRDLYEAQDDIERQKEELIVKVESRMQQRVSEQKLFTIRWEVR